MASPKLWVLKRDINLWVYLFLIVFSIAVAKGAHRLGLGDLLSPGPGFTFFWTSILLGVLSLHLFLKTLLTDAKKDKYLWKGKRWSKVASMVVCLIIYTLLLDFLGYILITFIVLVFLFRIAGGEKKNWILILMAAGVSSFVTYFVFSRLLALQFPKGILQFI